MVKQPAIDGIKKALRNFEARVIRQQAGIVLFHPQQKFGIGIFTIGNAAQLFDDQADMVIVKVNTLLHRLLDGMPVIAFPHPASGHAGWRVRLSGLPLS